MNAAIEILKRWQRLDLALFAGGLHLETFAKQNKVSTRTVRRDLEVFAALGHKAEHDLDVDGIKHVWEYCGGVELMFVQNFSPQIRAAVVAYLKQVRAKPANSRA